MAVSNHKNISVGKAGGVWAAGATDGAVHRLYQEAFWPAVWLPVKDGKADIIAAVDFGEAWCVNAAHEIWHIVGEGGGEGGQWTKVQTQSGHSDAKTISVGADGTVWYAQTDDKLFRREGSGWHADPTGRAAVIAAVSKDEVWAINAAHEVWHLTGGQWTKLVEAGPAGDTWTYTVKPGETLAVIAATQYNTNDWAMVNHIVDEIARLNSIANKNLVDAGRVLTMPPLSYK